MHSILKERGRSATPFHEKSEVGAALLFLIRRGSGAALYKNRSAEHIGVVIRGCAGGTLAPPEFGVSEKRTERVYYYQHPQI